MLTRNFQVGIVCVCAPRDLTTISLARESSLYRTSSILLVEATSLPFCDQCGKLISPDAVFCPSCGRKVQASPPSPTSSPVAPPPAQTTPVTGPVMIAETKNPGLTAVLALIVGIGLFGIGHIYVGRLRRGILLLLVSIVLHVGLALLFPFMMLSYIVGSGAPQTTAFVLLSLVNLVLWVWQSYDAYNLAKQFNEHVRQYGKAPW